MQTRSAGSFGNSLTFEKSTGGRTQVDAIAFWTMIPRMGRDSSLSGKLWVGRAVWQRNEYKKLLKPCLDTHICPRNACCIPSPTSFHCSFFITVAQLPGSSINLQPLRSCQSGFIFLLSLRTNGTINRSSALNV